MFYKGINQYLLHWLIPFFVFLFLYSAVIRDNI